LPALLMLLTFAVGILPPGTAVSDVRIPFGLGAATNLVLTALTAGRILWIRHATLQVALDSKFRSRCNRAIGLILESGAVYCIAAIFLVISASLNREIYSVGYGIGQQVLNIIPTFTLVYVGLNDTVANSASGSSGKALADQYTPSRLVARTVQPSGRVVVSDIKKEVTEEKGVERV